MRRFLLGATLVLSSLSATGQYWAGNHGAPLIPGQSDISASTPTSGPFAGWAGFMSGGQFQNGATNNFVLEYTDGTTDQNQSQSARGPVSVYCDVDGENQAVGSVTFNYGGFFGYAATPNGMGGFNDPYTVSGMMVRGGFSLDAGFQVAPGHSFGWVQMYRETKFDGTVTGWTIDSPNPATSPLYTPYTIPNPNGIGNMTAGLADVPFDPQGSVFKSLEFVSYLVCFDAGAMNLSLLGSFGWGYTHGGTTSSDRIASDYLTSYQDGVYSQKGAFLSALGAQSPGWTTEDGCNGCIAAVPEPWTIVLITASAALGSTRIRRRRSDLSRRILV